jgi:hypothetical protein
MQDKQIAGGSGLSEDPLKPEPHNDSTSSQSLLISSLNEKLRRRQVIADAWVAISNDIIAALQLLIMPHATYLSYMCLFPTLVPSMLKSNLPMQNRSGP